jgi:sugar transferase (PEP-CTERM/EpsH1 system associated)
MATRENGTRKLRILWVKMGGLWPLNTGGRLRSFHIVSELSRRHQVSVVTTHTPNEDPEALAARLPNCARIISFPHAAPKWHSARFPFVLLRSWFSPLSVDLWKFRLPPLRNEVARIMAEKEVDVCVADFLFAVPNVPLDGPVPVVFFAHNVEHMIWKRLSETETRIWLRPLLALEWHKMRRYEAEVCRRARLTLAVSPVDWELLAARAPGAHGRAIPTGVDVSYFAPNGSSEAPAQLVFTGSMDWRPNEDAILYFLEAILPIVRRDAPQTRLTVVGRNPSPRLRKQAAKTGAYVTGTVDDVRPYVAQAAVYVVPLRIGGGTRLKIFEALAMGKAVVSTTIGAEGLPLAHGEHFLRADEPVDFARAVVSLLRDPARRRRLGDAGRRLVEKRHAWPRVAHEFAQRCEEAVV